MTCWKGACKAIRNSPLETESAEYTPGLGCKAASREMTWSVPAPSPSYRLSEELERQAEKARLPQQIPQDLKDDLQKFKQKLLDDQAEQQRKAAMPKDGPEPPPDPYDLIVLEPGTGHKQPQLGDSVRIGYVVTMEVDASIVDARPDFEYTLGQRRGAGELKASALEAALVRMKRGERSTMKCALRDLFEADSNAVMQYNEEMLAVCEVKLSEIYHTKDCSFIKGSGAVIKDVIHEGMGAWCDNPTDEGSAIVRVEEVRSIQGECLFPRNGDRAAELEIVVGNGQVWDALECALLYMKRHETALITCNDPVFCMCSSCSSLLGIDALALNAGASYRVTLLDFARGPDVFSFEEAERLKFAYRRKAEANRLWADGRYNLARERYMRIIELFHHMDKKKFRDRFLGQPETLLQCKLLRKQCRLNAAACNLRLSEPCSARNLCDAVLDGEPENTKALYRRAQAFIQLKDYVQACHDLTRALDIDASIEDARRLLESTVKLRKASDQKQRKSFKFGCSIDGLNDPRTIKNDYMDTPMDLPHVQGQPVSSCLMPKKPT